MQTLTPQQRIKQLYKDCGKDLVRFNDVFLGGGRFWSRQVEICRSVEKYHTTLVPAGNMVGKSFVDARIIIGFLMTHPGCEVVATAPSQTQLAEVLWKEVERTYNKCKVPLGGRMLKSPLKIDLGNGWQALAYSTTKLERFSGHHAKDLLAIKDEASGIAPEISEAIDSLGPSRVLETGNPLRPDGSFYDRCCKAEGGGDRLSNLIRISSLESPHIHEDRSEWGLADATWLEKSRNDYGENSIWWKSHVLALFPDSAEDSLIDRSWLDAAVRATHVPGGYHRMAIDIGLGGGGDRSVIWIRDDNGLVDGWASNTTNLDGLAKQAMVMATKHGVHPGRVTFDASGIGADFANRLNAVGLPGACGYMGGSQGGIKFGNLRTAAAWLMRQRLNPDHKRPDGRPQVPFAIRQEYMSMLREELQGLQYELSGKDKVTLKPKEELAKKLRRSPDYADALLMSWAFPNT